MLSLSLAAPPAEAQAPGAPANLTRTPGDGKLDLSWTAPSGTVTGYDVHYTSSTVHFNAAVQGGVFTNPAYGWVDAGHSGTATSKTISNLANGTSYRVRVRAANNAGHSGWAHLVGVPRLVPPATPAGLTVRPGNTKLTLSWRAPPETVTRYDVHYTSAPVGTVANTGSVQGGAAPNPGAGWVDAGHTCTAALQTISSLTNGTAYRVRVCAANGAGRSNWAFGRGTPTIVAVMGLTRHTEVSVEGRPEVFEARLSEALPVATTVRIQVDTSDTTCPLGSGEGRATQTDDFTPPTTLSFPAGTKQVDFTIGIVADRTTEGELTDIRIPSGRTSGTGRIATRQDDDADDETFTVALDAANLPSPIVAGATASVTVTIDDDDTPTVELSASPRHPVAAGESVTVTARVSAALPGGVTIPLTLTPDAGTTSSDYGTLSSIMIPAGQTSGTGTIATVQDGDTVNQSFSVGLGRLPAEVQPGTRNWVRVTIAPASVPIVRLTAPATVDEGGTATVTARLTKPLSEAVTIPLTARFVGGPSSSHALTITTGATSGTLGIAVPRDDAANPATLIVEVDERMLPAVDPQVRAARYSSQYPRSVTILVRDIPAVYTERATAHEEQDGAVVFTVRLSYPPPHAVSVNYTTVQAAVAWQGAAPATAGSDYTHVSGTVKFGKGETAKKVRVPILDGAAGEGTEYFLLRFSNPMGAYLKTGETQGLIQNTD